MISKPQFFLVAVLIWSVTATPSGARAADSVTAREVRATPQPVAFPALQNTFRVTDRIFSGSQPDSDAAFAALARLGIRTVVSVDGSKPDLERAHKFGLKYVHLPIGYDGVPTNRVAELAKVLTASPGPFYVHCHHGRFRGPAAVAIMCESVEGWAPSEAVAWLKQAGATGEYPGLFRAVREFKPPSEAELAAAAFSESAPTSALVDQMVAIDEHFSRLKQAQKSGWSVPATHPDLVPKQEALMLWEQLRELSRTDLFKARPVDFHERLADSEKAAAELHGIFSVNSPNKTALDAALERAAQTCVTCHRRYRDP